MIKAGIVGGTGYTGGELIRLLLHHPLAELKFATSHAHFGKKIADFHPDLLGEMSLVFSENAQDCEVLFLALPHKESKAWLEKNSLSPHTRVIDLGNDFRVDPKFKESHFVYGLPEINKTEIENANYIANPGCFATAIELAILPIVLQESVPELYTTGITGATGAGKSLSETSHFPWRDHNISAYKTLVHQHLEEIYANIKPRAKTEFSLQFVPWRGDFPRGIFTSSTFKTHLNLDQLYDLYENFYRDKMFVKFSREPIFLKQIINTNYAIISIEKKDGFAVVHSAIDNLLKGASGQAIQNMNLSFGIPENSGLELKASVF